jgi:hypothetical protein
LGIRVNRIEKEFVLNSLINQKIPVRFHGNKKEFEGTLVDYSEVTLSFNVGESAGLEVGEELRIFFQFLNNTHTFSTKLTEIRGDVIITLHPEGLYKSLQRKHERVSTPVGITASFQLKGKSIELNFPKMESLTDTREYKAPSVDQANIRELVRSFRKNMKNRISEIHIEMMKDRVPNTYEERILYHSPKILWIPSTNEDFPRKSIFPNLLVLTKADLIQIERDLGTPVDLISSSLANKLYEKARAGIHSELFCPIVYHDYFIGYIHLLNNVDNAERITPEQVEETHQFSIVLCYSLETGGFFETSQSKERRFEARLIDISGSGLLFAHPSKNLSKELRIHTDLTISLTVQARKMAIEARVIRKFMDSSYLYIGLQFMQIAPEDSRLLFETLYGRDLSDIENEKWEGGIPPPELHFD